jgi:hypothetical protein
MNRISRGWSLMKQSWAVLQSDKELMLFPVLSSVACLFVLASFALPLIVSPGLWNAVLQIVHEELRGKAAVQQQALQLHLPAIVGFAFYLINYFVIVFFNTALVACAVKRFSGGHPTMGYGLREAAARWPQILAWSMLAATVGYVLRAIEERLGFVGKIVVGLVGVAWSVVTYLVVPVLAVERVGPFRAVRRSAELLTKGWGEAVVGNLSLGAAGFLMAVPGILLLLAAVRIAVASGTLWLGLALGVIGLTYLVACSIITSALQQVLLAGVYIYASTGQVPTGLSEDVLRSAFRPK